MEMYCVTLVKNTLQCCGVSEIKSFYFENDARNEMNKMYFDLVTEFQENKEYIRTLIEEDAFFISIEGKEGQWIELKMSKIEKN